MKKTNYFQYFNKKIYNDYIITNLLNRAKIKNTSVIVNSKLYIPHFIKDGETPESISEYYYKSTAYFWIILYANNIKNIYEDWPKPQDVLDKYVTNKYGSLEYAKTIIHHYEDNDGDYIPQNEWTGDYSKKISIYDYELDLNDKKRIINIIHPNYQTQIIREFQKIFL